MRRAQKRGAEVHFAPRFGQSKRIEIPNLSTKSP